ncbi:MAG TPA: NADPH:quinone oxidoreductase family protein [Acidimicrobiales bacterium]|nr:NADPH:quinone oxidoreductase family protein [Acidimicrobiales bacterium]
MLGYGTSRRAAARSGPLPRRCRVLAAMCKEFGPPESLVVEEVPDPVAKGAGVVVDVHAAGVNFPDFLIIKNEYQFKPPLPFAPGGEVAGVVSAVGPDASGVSVGDRVMAVPGFGGFAEKIAVPATSLIPVPEGMDMVTAAGFVMTYGTSYHALVDRAAIQPGESLLVLGAAGGVGLSAVELGKALGARVIAAASTDAKLAVARDHGADEGINYGAGDLRDKLRELVGNHGVDVVYDPVGGDLSEPALRSLAWNGRFLVIGFAAGTIPRIPLNLPLLKGGSVVGVFWGSFSGREYEKNRRNLAELGRLYTEGRIRPYVSATFPLAEAGAAIRELGDRRATGKVVVVTDAGAASRSE